LHHGARVGRVVWSVREGAAGEFDAPEILGGFSSVGPGGEPKPGDLLLLPDGSGPWRVVDKRRVAQGEAPENVLVVQLFGD
jgi:hypothetical protein